MTKKDIKTHRNNIKTDSNCYLMGVKRTPSSFAKGTNMIQNDDPIVHKHIYNAEEACKKASHYLLAEDTNETLNEAARLFSVVAIRAAIAHLENAVDRLGRQNSVVSA